MSIQANRIKAVWMNCNTILTIWKNENSGGLFIVKNDENTGSKRDIRRILPTKKARNPY